ncbi:TcmI family type II polyketide cyclase [Actinoplanes sp. N902-109]|uniref:TcmI family type II polyketide cyclase n=1 Tax=Actinoplanes sp. (strain N902-109) TaxID=649831 RepID=UPI0003295317|nr:TcmI family type II polyketide cyclase [Actinoplanes sp. N902-109]AGL16620.1 putative polyketide cyclase [Actinoplanes sp. N902-109]
MHRTLIVARLKDRDPAGIAEAFGKSDGTELPHLVGVARRTLFRFHDLYFHLVEADEDISARLYRERENPLYRELSARLTEFVSPYDPDWKEPRDAMAEPFYVWTEKEGRIQ